MYNYGQPGINGQLFGTSNTMTTPTAINPIVPYQFTTNGASQTLLRVNGIESAKAYPTQPNSMVALFDENEDVFYIKSTDASNFPTIKKYRFVEEVEKKEGEVDSSKFVTVDEFSKFKEEVLNAQQSIWKSISDGQSNNDGKSKWNSGQSSTDKTNNEHYKKQQ